MIDIDELIRKQNLCEHRDVIKVDAVVIDHYFQCQDCLLKHFKFPISILYSDPKESLPKAIKLLLKDIEENGLDRWNVEEITEEWGMGDQPKPVNLHTKEEFEI